MRLIKNQASEKPIQLARHVVPAVSNPQWLSCISTITNSVGSPRLSWQDEGLGTCLSQTQSGQDVVRQLSKQHVQNHTQRTCSPVACPLTGIL